MNHQKPLQVPSLLVGALAAVLTLIMLGMRPMQPESNSKYALVPVETHTGSSTVPFKIVFKIDTESGKTWTYATGGSDEKRYSRWVPVDA